MSRRHDVVVVGAGLFGSTIARELRRIGQDVLVIDSQHPLRGSRPAACLMKPSWLTSVSKEDQRRAMTVLERHHEVRTIPFALGLGRTADVLWIDPQTIIGGGRQVRFTEVLHIAGSPSGWHTTTRDGTFSSRRVVVAAGAWTAPLLNVRHDLVEAQAGVAHLWRDAGTSPAIRLWAPYRQLVRFNRGDGAWVGDGTALRPSTLDNARRQKSLDRCRGFLCEAADPHPVSLPEALEGWRPYVETSAPCWVGEVRPGLWGATGGAKNGTLAAGWAAHIIVGSWS